MVGTMPVQWFSKKCKQNVLSTAEAELFTAIETTNDIMIEVVELLLHIMHGLHLTSIQY